MQSESARRRFVKGVRSALVIAAREIYEHSREPLVWMVVLFTSLLSGFATRVGLEELETRRSVSTSFAAQRAADRTDRRGQIAGWQIEPALRAIRPPEPLSAIVSGVDVTLPQYWDFGPAGVRTGQSYLGTGEPPVNIDLEFIIRVALGLLAILIATESIAGERTSGALLALLGQPVRPRVILAGKLLGAGVTLASCIVILLAVVLGTTALSQPQLLSSGFVGSIVGVGMVGWLYVSIFFTFGVLVSSVFVSHRAALTAASIVWLVSGAPGIAVPHVVARSLAPLAPASLREAQVARTLQEETKQVQMKMGDRYLQVLPAGTDWTRVERDPAALAAIGPAVEGVWQDQVNRWRADHERVLADAANAAATRRWILGLLMLASPGAQFADAAANLAGTGTTMATRWQQTTDRYQGALNEALFYDPPRVTLLVPAEPHRGPGVDGRYLVSFNRRAPMNASALPEFSPPAMPFTRKLADGAPRVATLLAYVLALSAAATIAFERIRF